MLSLLSRVFQSDLCGHILSEDYSLHYSEFWSNVEVKRSKVKVTGIENAKFVLRAYLREKWIDLQLINIQHQNN